MKQFQVPQFIDVEDKILGPITMRQFFIMLIPFGIGILLYFLVKLWLVVILIIPITAVAAMFAFYRPYGMRFSRFFSAFLTFNLKPRMYIWHREEQDEEMLAGINGEGGPATAKSKTHAIAPGKLGTKRSGIEIGSTYTEKQEE